jgi:RNA polymerase sigma-70 factor (ECF subfamily)
MFALAARARPLLPSLEMLGQGPTVANARADDAALSEDAALVAAIAGGDRDALGALYDRHAPTLLGFARRMLGTGSAAEDLLHDLFLEVWQHAVEYAPERGSVRAWLIVRARSRALDRLGRQAREARIAAEISHATPVASAAPSPPTAIDAARIRQLVATLPPDLTAVLDCAYFEGLSATEIAARLGIPVGTAKSRLARALGLLREGLAPIKEDES